MKTNQNFNRRDALKQIGIFSLGLPLLPLAFSTDVESPGKSASLENLLPFYLPPQEEPLKEVAFGLGVRTLIHSAQTNGQFSCVEVYSNPMQMGPAPHVHKKLDELMYVTEGTVSWMIGDKTYQVKAGGWIFRPHGIVHSFWNATDKPAIAIDMFFQQNLEDYLDTLFNKIFADMIKYHLPPTDPGIIRRMKALDEKYGITTFADRRQAIVEKYGLHP